MSTPGPAVPLIQVRELTRTFGALVAASGITFDVPRGQIFGLAGPGGAGKSATLRMLAGVLAPTSGRITGFAGLDVVRDAARWKQRTGYMSQRFSLYLDLTVQENLHFIGSIYDPCPALLRDRIGSLAARLDLEPLLGSVTSLLSTCERQRVALVASLLHEPELLLLDEPASGLDPHAHRALWELIGELTTSRGTTVVVTTRNPEDAVQCDRLALIQNGRVVAEGAGPSAFAGVVRRTVLAVQPPIRATARAASS